ncbi:hypothetical protein ACA910_014109 [Epithemia clementina (nom. ined.)]
MIPYNMTYHDQFHKAAFHSVHIRNGEKMLYIEVALSTVVACLLCIGFICMIRRGRKLRCCCGGIFRRKETGTTIREYATLDDWVCEMDGDQEGGFVAASAATDTNQAQLQQQDHRHVLDESEWEEVTVDSIFPDLTRIARSGRKKHVTRQTRGKASTKDKHVQSSLTESLLPPS